MSVTVLELCGCVSFFSFGEEIKKKATATKCGARAVSTAWFPRISRVGNNLWREHALSHKHQTPDRPA